MSHRPGEPIEVVSLKPPRADEAYRLFIPASLLLAVFLGFALGIHISVSRLTGGGDPGRSADLIQAHGQVQLLGFAGLYVMGMSLRLLPRFAGERLARPALLPVILGCFVLSLILRAIVLPLLSGDAHDIVLLAVSIGLLGGSAGFLLVTASTALRRGRPMDVSVAAFLSGAAFLFVSSLLALGAATDAVSNGERTLPFLTVNAILQLQLAGFVMAYIIGVAIRAIPTITGVARPSGVARSLLVAGLVAAVSVLAGSLLYLEYGAYAGGAVRVAAGSFLALGVVFLSASWQAGPLRSFRNRLRPASETHLWLVRSAFVWLTVAGGIAIYGGAKGLLEETLPSQFEFDAVRHSLGLGVVTNLIVGMSLMIVPEFAAQRQHADQRRLALVLCGLINLATVLRVAPALAGTSWSFDQRNLSMAVAGTLAEVALIVFAVTLLRLLRGGQDPAAHPDA